MEVKITSSTFRRLIEKFTLCTKISASAALSSSALSFLKILSV